MKNSQFSIGSNLGGYGIAGGAITTEGSYLTIDSSNFNIGEGSHTYESGGFIQVVGTGEFDLKNSTLNGSGTAWNSTSKYKTTKYGGGIVFYNGSTVTATITDTTIQNITSEISGAGIAVANKVGDTAGVNLIMTNVNVLNNAT